MADTKITALTALTAADPANDVIPIVDVSDTSMAASGTTKKISVNNILGASGTATLASATITGDLTVDTSTLKVDSTNNRVGIGTASPVASFQATISGLYGICIQSADTNNSALNIGNDPTSGYAFIDATKSGSGSFLPLRLSTSDNERIRIETAGDVKIVTGNVVMATSGKGIDFTAAGNVAGMTSELLADYEEGTWTPTLQFSTLSVGVTYSTQTGIYTKVGRIVHFSGRIDLSSKGTSNGSAAIAGLPFAANTGAASVGYQSSIAPSGSQAMLTIGGTELIVRYASATTTAQSTDSDFSNSSIIIFAGTYAV